MRKFLAALAVLLPSLVWAQQGGQVGIIGPNGNPATINGNNELRVNPEAGNVFQDTFFTFDTVKNWTSQSAGGGVAAALNGGGVGNGGSIGIGSGTTANGYSCVITNKPGPFNPVQPGFLTFGFRIQFTTPVPVNSYGFWGVTPSLPTTPTTAVPLTEAVGFELTSLTLGGPSKLQLVSYAVGTGRTLIKDLSSTGTNKQPTDGGTYTWYLAFRPDKFNFSLTDQDNVIANATGAVGPNNNSVKPVVCTIAGSTAPASSLTLTVPAIFVGDNGHNSAAISDGVDAWQKATVNSGMLFAGGQYSYFNMTTASTLTLKSGAGFLHTVCINTPAAGTLSMFDNTAGSGVSIGVLTEVAAQIPNCSTFDVAFATGLTLVQGAAGNVTASFK